MVVTPPVVIPFSQGLALRTITLRITRSGEQTPAIKLVRMVSQTLQLVALFSTAYEASSTFLASAIDMRWIFLATDETAPPKAAALYPEISEDVVLELDLSDGAGSGGSPAAIDARVRVGGVPAAREVVAVERRSDGVWRVAGNGTSDDSGIAALDLRVGASGSVYAICLDAWGVPFQPLLGVAVGVVVRPSQYVGWLYRITEAGTLPGSEPEWWAAEGDNAPRLLGTARAIAVRYYQPLAHGPVPVEIL